MAYTQYTPVFVPKVQCLLVVHNFTLATAVIKFLLLMLPEQCFRNYTIFVKVPSLCVMCLIELFIKNAEVFSEKCAFTVSLHVFINCACMYMYVRVHVHGIVSELNRNFTNSILSNCYFLTDLL